MGAGPILEGQMCWKEQILQAAGKDICLSLSTVQKGIAGSYKVWATWRKSLGSVVMQDVMCKLCNRNIPEFSGP